MVASATKNRLTLAHEKPILHTHKRFNKTEKRITIESLELRLDDAKKLLRLQEEWITGCPLCNEYSAACDDGMCPAQKITVDKSGHLCTYVCSNMDDITYAIKNQIFYLELILKELREKWKTKK